MSENDENLNVSVDDINDIVNITPMLPTSKSDGTTRTDLSGSSYAVSQYFSDTDSEASDFEGFLPEDF